MPVKHKTTSCKDLFYREIDDGDIIYYILKPQKNSKEDKEKIIGKKSDGITEEDMCEQWIKKLRPRERYSTNKTGVFWRHCTTDGKDDKTYYITYKVQDEKDPTKKKTVESVVGKYSQNVRIAYAHQKYIETVNNLKTGEPVPIKRKKKKYYTLQNAFDEYIQHVKSEGKKTWKKDQEIYTNHLERFHQVELVSLTQENFNDLKNEKLKTHSKRTVQYILAVARQIINYAITYSKDKEAQRYINPIANGKVKVKKIDNANKAFFKYDQAELLLKELEKYKLSSSLIYQLTIALLHTGARFSEVASLNWDDIKDDGTIYFKATKEGNARHVSMSNQLKAIIEELPKRSELVFSTPKGTQIQQMPDSWQRIVDKLFPENVITVKRTEDGVMLELSQKDRELLEKQTKNRLTVHSLRHTHASWMAMSGNFTLLEIRDELGHKTTKMTERYAHLMPEDRHKKVSALFDDN